MIEIDRMNSVYRLAGAPDRRDHLARRLDRIVNEHVTDALETMAGEFATGGGPVYKIRRLDLKLWLNTASLNDGDIGRRWAGSVAKALYRQIAEGGPGEVMRYPSQAVYQAAWLTDLLDHRSEGRWEYAEFDSLEGLPIGRAAAVVLARDGRWIMPTLRAIDGSGRVTALIQTFCSADVELLWSALAGGPPQARSHLAGSLIRTVAQAGIRPPAIESGGDSDARARGALRWLVALVLGPSKLRPEAAVDLAMQLGHLSALAEALPGLRPAIESAETSLDQLLALLDSAPSDLAVPSRWLRQVLAGTGARSDAADLMTIVTGTSEGRAASGRDRTRTRISSYAGVGLLLPALQANGLGDRLGPYGRHRLLAAAVGNSHQVVARSDPALLWLAGLADNKSDPGDIEWPTNEEMRIDEAPVAPDADTFGSGPELAALRSTFDSFASGLRGMEGSTLEYLAKQFFRRGGALTRRDDALTVRLHSLPMRVLLEIGGRLGDQGPIDWLDGRRLVIEIGDGLTNG